MKAGSLRIFFFFVFASFGVFQPYFPAWLEARGVRGAAMSGLMALGPALGMIGPPCFGALSDWLGLRAGLLRLATAAGLAATVSLAVPGALGRTPALPVLFVAMLLLSMSRAQSIAMADVVALEASKVKGPAGRAPSYGSFRLWGSIGFMVSVVAVGRALDVRALAALPLVLLGLALVTSGVSFSLDAPAPARVRRLGEPLSRLLRDRAFVMLLVSAFLGYGAHASYDICFSLHLTRLGVGVEWVGVAWGIGVLAEAGLMAASGRLLAAVPAPRLVLVAFAVGALRWALLATVQDVPALLALQPLHAISFSLFWVASMEHVRSIAPKEILATAQGVFKSSVSAGSVAGVFVWGATFEVFGGPTTFALAALTAGAAFAAAWMMPRAFGSAANTVSAGRTVVHATCTNPPRAACR